MRDTSIASGPKLIVSSLSTGRQRAHNGSQWPSEAVVPTLQAGLSFVYRQWPNLAGYCRSLVARNLISFSAAILGRAGEEF